MRSGLGSISPAPSAPISPAPPSVTYAPLGGATGAPSFLEQQRQRDIERAEYWQSRGYNFNPQFMSSYLMDQKVRDIERARYWKERG
jgi:hypothetical protein